MSTSTATPPKSAGNQPYCSNCGYILTGLTDSSKCPECGRPIVEVLTRAPRYLERGKRYRSKAKLFGLPVLDIALGPKNGELTGKARGIIAIGDLATGGIAIGGFARGIVAIGGFAMGLFSIGGASLGLITALGGCAVGGMAAGGGAIGVLASGGGAVGLLAQGGGAAGWFTRSARGATPEAAAVFQHFTWFFGGRWPGSPMGFLQPLAVVSFLPMLAALLIGSFASLASSRQIDDPPDAAKSN